MLLQSAKKFDTKLPRLQQEIGRMSLFKSNFKLPVIFYLENGPYLVLSPKLKLNWILVLRITINKADLNIRKQVIGSTS